MGPSHRFSLRPSIAVALLALLAVSLALPAVARAAIITVGPGCSLIDAIKSANANADVGTCAHTGDYGADTIVLPFGTYTLTAVDNIGVEPDSVSGGGPAAPAAVLTGSNNNGLPAITSDITIAGSGSTITRSLGANPPFFRIFDVGSTGILRLQDLTVSGGRLQDASTSIHGGAIRVIGSGQLVLHTVTLSGNTLEASATGSGSGGDAQGGAVYVEDGGRLTVIDSIFTGNAARANGAGLDGDGGTALGGAIYVTDGGADISVSGSVISGNAVSANGANATRGGTGGTASGAGIYVDSSRSLALTGVTVSFNTASATGGNSSSAAEDFAGAGGTVDGIGVHYESFGSGNLTVSQSVFSLNTAAANGGNGGGKFAGDGGTIDGGGLFVQGGAGAFSVTDASFNHNTLTANGGQGTGVSGGDGGTTQGGGIYSSGSGSLLLERVSISNNTGSGAAGANSGAGGGSAEGLGLFVSGFGAGPVNATLRSATLANNSGNANGSGIGQFSDAGNAQGGGIYAEGGVVVNLVNCTITNNAVTGIPNGLVEGGGLHGDDPTVTFTVRNTILTNNTASAGPNCESDGPVTSLGNNLLGSLAGCGLAGVGSDQTGASPSFGAFVDDGRPASGFFPLATGSPAIDAANSGACPAADQRGQGRAGACDVGAVEVVVSTDLVAAILPISRAGLLGGASLTAFGSVINVGGAPAFNVRIEPVAQGGQAPTTAVRAFATQAPSTLHFQTTDPATNTVNGTADTGATIPPGGIQTYVIVVRPTAPFDPTQLGFRFAGPNTAPAPTIAGLDTLLASSATSPIPDIVALAGTVNNDGIVTLGGPGANGAFTVATVNLGAAGQITVRPDAGSTQPAPAVFVCQTNPATSICTTALGATVQTAIGSNETPTFAIFAVSNGAIPFNPAVNRISVFFEDAGGKVRGATGVAVRTE